MKCELFFSQIGFN